MTKLQCYEQRTLPFRKGGANICRRASLGIAGLVWGLIGMESRQRVVHYDEGKDSV